MGTFIVKPTSIVSGDTPTYDANALPLNPAGWALNNYPTVSLLDAILANATEPNECGVIVSCDDVSSNLFHQTLRLGFSGDSIYLDGSLTPIAFADLPSGFTPLSAVVTIPAPSIQVPGAGSSHFYLQNAEANEGTEDSNTFSYDFSIPPSMLDIVTNGMGLRVAIDVNDISDAAGVGFFPNGFYNFRIEGTYDIEGFTYDLEQPDNPIKTGDTITITFDPKDPNHLDPKQFETLKLTYTSDDPMDPTEKELVTDPTKWVVTITESLITITFLVPDLLSLTPDFPPRTVIVKITSTQFSGSVTLGKLITIYFLDAPGIYKLVPDKTTDTLYDTENGGTVDVKIPDPFIKTGYFV